VARHQRERRAAVRLQADTGADTTGPELWPLLDDEIGRLPERYRAPLVLCYLEGKTQEQAARALGYPRSSLSTRLGRARSLLRERLVRRGIVLSAGLLTGVLAEQAVPAAVPALLFLSTARAATCLLTDPVATTNAG